MFWSFDIRILILFRISIFVFRILKFPETPNNSNLAATLMFPWIKERSCIYPINDGCMHSRVQRFRVQRSGLRTRKDIEDPKSSLKMLISPNNCKFGSKFWIRLDEIEVYGNTPLIMYQPDF